MRYCLFFSQIWKRSLFVQGSFVRRTRVWFEGMWWAYRSQFAFCAGLLHNTWQHTATLHFGKYCSFAYFCMAFPAVYIAIRSHGRNLPSTSWQIYNPKGCMWKMKGHKYITNTLFTWMMYYVGPFSTYQDDVSYITIFYRWWIILPHIV